MRTKTTCLIVFILLMIADSLPFPIIGVIGLYVILERPPWFIETVKRLYAEGKR